VKGSTKRRADAQTQTASPSTWGASALFPNGDVHCGSKPVRWQCRVPFNPGKDAPWVSRRASPFCQSPLITPRREPDGPTENMYASPPARKAYARETNIPRRSARQRYTRKSWQRFERRLPLRGAMKKRLLTKPGWGRSRTAPVRSVKLSGRASS
jgi:hypothetical protein